MPSELDLASTRIAVVGATGAIGSHLVSQLTEAGADVLAGARTMSDLDALPSDTTRQAVDVRDPRSVDDFVDAAAGAEGVDVVVCVSGVVAIGPITELSVDAVRASLDTDLLGPILLARAALPRLREHGRIVVTGAITADEPTAGLSVHSAAKGGLSAFAAALRHELRHESIDIVEVRLPRVDTGLEDRAIEGSGDDLDLRQGVPVEAAVAALLDGIAGAASVIDPAEVVASR